jgi:hypothetical protein
MEEIMKQWLGSMLRRLGAISAGLTLALTAVVAVGSPAQAAPPGCTMGAGHYESAGSYITAYKYWFCESGPDIPLSVSIQRNLSPGVWQTVASGTGETTYYCSGSAGNFYKTTGTSQFWILCG